MSAARVMIWVALGMHSGWGAAAVSCEQLAEIAYTTEQLRNQGQSLSTVVAEAEKLESSGKFTRADLDLIKDVVERAFKGIQSPLEVLEACRKRLKR